MRKKTINWLHSVPSQRAAASTLSTSSSSTSSSSSQSSTTSRTLLPALSSRQSFRPTNMKSFETPSVIIPPVPAAEEPPVLLLEGDEYCFSQDGVARTLYELQLAATTNHSPPQKRITMEELYDLNHAHKTFVMRQQSSSHNDQDDLGPPSFPPVQIQEIPSCDGLLGKAGTGATTWEASIAMALQFSLKPDLLRGKVVELGSGVGLGGILSASRTSSSFQSWTMTDGNSQVLQYCRENLDTALKSQLIQDEQDVPIMSVAKLDWNEFLHKQESISSQDHRHQYDTVIACDCAYLYTDIDILAKTMVSLLKPGLESRIHIFGPNNRGALQELVQYLKDEWTGLDVSVDTLTLTRQRLRPNPGSTHGMFEDNIIISQSLPRTSGSSSNTYTATFLHVTASFAQQKDASNTMKTSSVNDID